VYIQRQDYSSPVRWSAGSAPGWSTRPTSRTIMTIPRSIEERHCRGNY